MVEIWHLENILALKKPPDVLWAAWSNTEILFLFRATMFYLLFFTVIILENNSD